MSLLVWPPRSSVLALLFIGYFHQRLSGDADIKPGVNLLADDLENPKPSPNKETLKILLVSTWRSGSTFLGALISSHPSVFYHYEPLTPLAPAEQLRRGDPREDNATALLRGLYSCRHEDPGFLKFVKSGTPSVYNKVISKHCSNINDSLSQPERRAQRNACSGDGGRFLDSLCTDFPAIAAKTVRMRMGHAGKLLHEESLPDLKVIYLVRDPRGTMSSRSRLNWCRETMPDCHDPERLCGDLTDDFIDAKRLKDTYPDRVKIIRYESLMTNVSSGSRNLLSWLGLDAGHPDVASFVDSHTGKDEGGAFSTLRNSTLARERWRSKMPSEQIRQVQKSCSVALSRWRYRIYQNVKRGVRSGADAVLPLELED